MAAQRETEAHSGLYLAITVLALLVAVYFALQLLAFFLKLAFLVLAVVIAVAAYRAWRSAG
jgi:hypothetical protein